MLKKRYIVIAIGIVSVLLGSLFISNIILAQTGGEYDPWLDLNEDGTIDVNDLSPMGQSYGSSGDTTKNVNVTNFPLDDEGNLKVSIQEEPPGFFIDSVVITLLNFPSNTNFSVLIPQTRNATLPFVFAPKGTLIGVTNAWITVVARKFENIVDIMHFNITVNNLTLTTYNWYPSDCPHIVAMPLEEAMSTIHDGINTVLISNAVWSMLPGEWLPCGLLLYQVDIFIEYEYQA